MRFLISEKKGKKTNETKLNFYGTWRKINNSKLIVNGSVKF